MALLSKPLGRAREQLCWQPAKKTLLLIIFRPTNWLQNSSRPGCAAKPASPSSPRESSVPLVSPSTSPSTIALATIASPVDRTRERGKRGILVNGWPDAANALGVPGTAQFKSIKYEPPAARQKGILVQDVAQLVSSLRAKGLV